MIIGIPKEIKDQEYRVGLPPAAVYELTRLGHSVQVEADAGKAIGYPDSHYLDAGAKIAGDAKSLWGNSNLIIKVKEPLPAEFSLMHSDQILFTYLHLAADEDLTQALLTSGIAALGYETVVDQGGQLPLLIPMSEIAGRFAIQAAARCLEVTNGGRGILLGGVPGVAPAKVLILGGGVVGLNAARMALGVGAQVTIMDKSTARLRYIDEIFNHQIETLYAHQDNLEKQLPHSDVVVGAVLIPGAVAPQLLSREQLALMQAGSVLIDVAIDQGGCFATSRPTSHAAPTFIVDQIVHYCVANIPGAVALTATQALSNASLPYVIKLANEGLMALADPYFRSGLNTYKGHITHREVATAFSLPYSDPLELLNR